LVPLDHPQLDNESRFVLQLLKDMYQVGLTKTSDRISTERANAMIAKLADDASFEAKHSLIEQRAKRADAILQGMELYVKLATQYQSVALPVALPVPNHETYSNVLRLFSSRFLNDSRDIPLRCHEIVERMESSGDLALKPGVKHWNDVLSAWANSKDPERPIHAAKLLQNLHIQKKTDSSSFSHALRACVSVKQRGQVADAKFRKLASEVALMVWNVLQEDGRIAVDSYHYVHYLRSVRNLAKDDRIREQIVQKTMEECCNRGKVNPHVLQEFQSAASKKQQEQLLGVHGTFNMDPLELIHKIPSDWIKHADGNKFGW
jgi:hypothetical protein